MAKRPVDASTPLPDPTPETASPPIECQRLYGLERDVATGCWVESYHDVPIDIVRSTLVKTGDARHSPGCLAEIEKDARRRVG